MLVLPGSSKCFKNPQPSSAIVVPVLLHSGSLSYRTVNCFTQGCTTCWNVSTAQILGSLGWASIKKWRTCLAVCMVCSMGARPEYSLLTSCSNINCPQNFPNRVWKVYNEQGIKNSSCELLAIGKKRAPSKRNQFTGTEEKSCWGLCNQGTENWYSKVDYQNGGL